MTEKSTDLEIGDLSDFDSTVVDAGHLSVETAAKYRGTYGMQCNIQDTNNMWGRWIFASKTRLRIGFWFNVNSLTMADGDLFNMVVGSGNNYFRLSLEKSGSIYEIWSNVMNDTAGWDATPNLTLPNRWTWIEIDYKRSTGSNDGYIKIWLNGNVDGTPDTEKTGIDDDLQVYTDVLIGVMYGIDETTSGQIFYDQMVINDTGATIGPIGNPPVIYHHRVMQSQS